MAGMLDLADVLELVVDRLDDRALAQEQLVRESHQAVAHVLAPAGDKLDRMLDAELLGHRLRDVALVAEELATEALDALEQGGDGLAVVDVTAGEAEGEQLALIVDHQMQLEAVEPAQRSLAAGRIDGEHAVLWDTGVMGDGQGRGGDEAEAGAPGHLGLQIGDPRQQHTRHEFDEPGIAHQLGELRMQLLRHVLGVIGLESAVMRGLKEDQDGHDLTGMQLARPSALPLARGQHLTVPQRLEADPELVDRAEEFEYTHDRNLLMISTMDRDAIVSGGFSFGDFAYPELTLLTIPIPPISSATSPTTLRNARMSCTFARFCSSSTLVVTTNPQSQY